MMTETLEDVVRERDALHLAFKVIYLSWGLPVDQFKQFIADFSAAVGDERIAERVRLFVECAQRERP
jgi:hypothetical protein